MQRMNSGLLFKDEGHAKKKKLKSYMWHAATRWKSSEMTDYRSYIQKTEILLSLFLDSQWVKQFYPIKTYGDIIVTEQH